MKTRPILAVVIALLLGLTAASCSGGDDGPEPSALVKSLEGIGIPGNTAACVEKAGKEADLSAKQIRELARGKTDGVTEKERVAYAKVLSTCMGLDQSIPTTTR